MTASPVAPESDGALARAILAEFAPTPTRAVLAASPPPEAMPDAPAHHVAARQRWPWLPTLEHRHLAQHPFCDDCGAVKYVGSMRPVPLGGLVNAVAGLRSALEAGGRRVSDAQVRLIIKRLESEGAADTFANSRPIQERQMLTAFAAYTGIDPAVLASFLRSS